MDFDRRGDGLTWLLMCVRYVYVPFPLLWGVAPVNKKLHQVSSEVGKFPSQFDLDITHSL